MNEVLRAVGIGVFLLVAFVVVINIIDFLDCIRKRNYWYKRDKDQMESSLKITQGNYDRLNQQYMELVIEKTNLQRELRESEARGSELSANVCCGGGIYSSDSGNTECKFVTPIQRYTKDQK